LKCNTHSPWTFHLSIFWNIFKSVSLYRQTSNVKLYLNELINQTRFSAFHFHMKKDRGKAWNAVLMGTKSYLDNNIRLKLHSARRAKWKCTWSLFSNPNLTLDEKDTGIDDLYQELHANNGKYFRKVQKRQNYLTQGLPIFFYTAVCRVKGKHCLMY